jgi:hypothetical protein
MHQNPCKGRWYLSNTPYEYPHSSAAFYEKGKEDTIVKDYRDYLALLNELEEIAIVKADESRINIIKD